jgi:hypothetical protein
MEDEGKMFKACGSELWEIHGAEQPVLLPSSPEIKIQKYSKLKMAIRLLLLFDLIS